MYNWFDRKNWFRLSERKRLKVNLKPCYPGGPIPVVVAVPMESGEDKDLLGAAIEYRVPVKEGAK